MNILCTLIRLALISTIGILSVRQAPAQLFNTWIGPDGGEIFNDNNWTSDIANGQHWTFDNGNEAVWGFPVELTLAQGTTMYMNGSDVTVDTHALVVGGTGDGLLGIDAGTLTSVGGVIGELIGDWGHASISNTGSIWNVTGSLRIGEAGTGTLNLSYGGAATATGTIDIGSQEAGVGVVTLTGDSASITAGANFVVGGSGRGRLEVSGIASVPIPSTITSNAFSIVGDASTSFGEAYVRSGAYWLSQGQMQIGRGGIGLLELSSGGLIEVNDNAAIGVDGSGHGEVNVGGANATWDIAGSLTVGNEGRGKLRILDGGLVENTSAIVGASDFGVGVGEVTVTGIGSQWTNSSSLTVGNFGTGSLLVSDGGLVTNTTSTLAFGVDSSSNVLVTGPDSTWTSTDEMTVGNSGDAVLTVRDGATLHSDGSSVARLSGSVSSIHVHGPQTTWQDSGSTIVGYGNGGNGTLTIEAGATVTSSQAVVGFSGTAVGNATVSGPDSTWNITTGTLQVASAGLGTLIINDGGRVLAAANVAIANASGSGGDVLVDGGSSELHVGGDLLLNAGIGSLTIDNGGVVAVAGDTTIGSGDLLSVNSGTFTTTNLTNNGSFAFGSGLVEIQGGDAVFNSSLSLGNTAGTEFRVIDGADAAVEFAFILGSGVDFQASAVISGTSSDGLRRSTIRGTGGGGGADLVVGRSGDATLLVSDGGLADLRDDFIVAENPGSSGAVTVSGVSNGFRSTIEANNGGTGSLVQVGLDGDGSLSITNGALVTTTGKVTIGTTAGSTGTVYVGGSAGGFDATLETTTDLEVADSTSTGSLTIATGGQVLVGGDMFVGNGGTLILDGGTLTPMGDEMNVALAANFEFRAGTLDVDTSVSLVDVPSGLTIPAAGTVELATSIDGDIRSLPGSTINVNGTSRIGWTPSFLGVNLQGTLNVGANNIQLRSAAFSQLGELTTIAGGTITAANGVALGAGDVLTGRGTVDGKVAAAAGSTIDLVDNTTLGDSDAFDGFISQGAMVLRNGGNFTIQDRNQAQLGALTTLVDDATLNAPNGVIVDFGAALTGYGTLSVSGDPKIPSYLNGNVEGDNTGIGDLIYLQGYFKGVGSLNNVSCGAGCTISPGLSPAAVYYGEVTYGGTLEIELGGTTPGVDFDQVNHALGTGIADLGGTLDIQFINGFTPSSGDSFDILTGNDIQGTFAAENLPAIGGGLMLDVFYSPTVASVAVVGIAGDYNLDGVVNLADYTVWRNNLGSTGPALAADGDSSGTVDTGDYNVWKTNFGMVAPLAAVHNAVAVPEPRAVMLLCSGIFLLIARRRSRRVD